MYVIMGATGNIGSKLATILLDKGEQVTGISRSAERLQPFIDRGAIAAIGDVADAGFLTNAYKDANAVFAMLPPDYQAKDFRKYYNELGGCIVKAIQESGVKHIVFLSSHGAHLPDKTGPIKGLHDVEQKLNALKDVNVLHLRPTYFMENLVANIAMIKSIGMNGGGVKGNWKFPMVATKDIAPVAAEHLLKRDFSGKAAHELLGERDVTMNEVTKVLGKKIDKPDLGYVQFSPEDEKKGLMDCGLSDDASDQLVELSQAINDGIMAVNRTAKNTTETSIEEFSDFFAQVYKGS
jgi:uncharacterized protein YbjT (DUF2867 family)